MRRLLVLAAVLSALSAPSGALASPVFVVNGRGWGHGIGLAQYGAHGYAAREGRSAAWILRHYYRGTRLGRAPVRTVRVQLTAGRSSVWIRSDARFRLVDARGRSYFLPAGTRLLRAPIRVWIAGKRRLLASPVRFLSGRRHLKLDGRPYRGSLVVIAAGRSLSVVNRVGLEAYLAGVVPWEMPASWAREALKAQAVAARSYAIVSRRSSGAFDLYDDTRSQVYGGILAEDRRATAAVRATAGIVVKYRGRVAWTFFHSTSGGRTAAIHDAWPGARPLPYLVSVRDPHDWLSPYHRWGPLTYSPWRLARLLRAGIGGVRSVSAARNPSRRVSSVVLRGSRGTARIPGDSFRYRLGLRSSWFSIGVLSLRASRARVGYGGAVVVRGVARGVRRPWLERKVFGRGWERSRRLSRRPGGAFRVVMRPAKTTWYRVASGRAKGTARRVAVAPRVNFYAYRGGNALRGLVRPRRAGALVRVQRLSRGRWVTRARARTSGAGEFRARLVVSRGTYRAVARIGSGFVPGISPRLTIVSG